MDVSTILVAVLSVLCFVVGALVVNYTVKRDAAKAAAQKNQPQASVAVETRKAA